MSNSPIPLPQLGSNWLIEHDGFIGEVIGYYKTKEGKQGVVLQQQETKVVHVYALKWLLNKGEDFLKQQADAKKASIEAEFGSIPCSNWPKCGCPHLDECIEHELKRKGNRV